MSSISEPMDLAPDPPTASEKEVSRVNNLMFARLMPLLVIGYIINFLDRTNIGMAKSALQIDVGISAASYGLGAGLYFLVYAACEVPSNLILQKVGARRWITRIMFTWGIISMCMALVKGPTSFYALRVLLGVAEAGLFPGVLFYLNSWFGARQNARATGYFLFGVCLANAIGGPLGGAILTLNGWHGLKGWQWLFILEGAPAVLFSYVIWKFLPDGPASAPWLTKAESDGVLSRLKAEREANAKHYTPSLKSVFGHPQILLAIWVYFCDQIALYGVIFFLPGIVRSWGGLGEIQIGLLSSLPWVCCGLGAIIIPQVATQFGKARETMIGGMLMMAVVFTGPVFLPPVGALIAFCLGSVMFMPLQSILFTYPYSRMQGTALAGGLGYLNGMGLVGGFLGPYAMGLVEQATGKASNGLWLMSGALLAGAIGTFWLRYPSTDKIKAAPG